jgi:hypothetical protein
MSHYRAVAALRRFRPGFLARVLDVRLVAPAPQVSAASCRAYLRCCGDVRGSHPLGKHLERCRSASFDDSPIERAEVSFNGEQWIVDDVDERYSPAQVTLVRRP